MEKLEEFVHNNKYIIAAHRGASGLAPENTLSAFKLAVESGANMIEIDVQFAKDDSIIVFHDENLGRTTNCSGRIKNYTLEELKKMDSGSWFSESFANEKILTLAETLEYLKDKAYLSIEIKPNACYERQEDAVRKIIKVVRDLKLENNVLFGSFDYQALKLIKQLDSKLNTAAIKIPNDKRLPSEVKSAIHCDAYICSLREITHKICADAVKSGMFVGVYSINNEADLNKILKYNVKALATNFPKEIIKKMNDLAVL